MDRQKELENMSAQDINRLVAGDNYYCKDEDDESILIDDGFTNVNYCECPADIMPIAWENKIATYYRFTGKKGEFWEARGNNPNCRRWVSYSTSNPMRAACIVLILMKETAND